VTRLIEAAPARQVESLQLGDVQPGRVEPTIGDPPPMELDDLVVIAVAALHERIAPLRGSSHRSRRSGQPPTRSSRQLDPVGLRLVRHLTSNVPSRISFPTDDSGIRRT
jgi:hypothetical protein